jgi:DNA repair protein RadD
MRARDYQSAAVQSIYDYFTEKTGNPIIAMPTGTGKSVVIAALLWSIYQDFPRQRVIIATHVKELIAQNLDKLVKVWPQAPAGVYSAGLGLRESMHPITFAGIASVCKKAAMFGRVDLLIIDEAHLVSPTEETMYRQFINDLLKINPNLKVIGLTATPWRLGHGKITEGGIFTDVCFDMTGLYPFNWLIEQGYLSPLIPKGTRALLDTSGVHLRGGEFIANELQSAVDKHHVTEAALKELIEHAGERRSWLVFAAGVQHANHVSDMLCDMGVQSAAVHSKMPDKDRDRILREFLSGRLKAVVNNNVLTTGFDHPGIDLIGMLRPTASPVLWVQMLGRGTRALYGHGNFDLNTKEGRLAAIAAGPKQNCLVLDFAGNTKRLGPINDPVIPRKKGEKGGDAPVKQCGTCGVWNHASVRVCVYCAAPFPEPQLKIKATAGTEALVKVDTPVVESFKVDHITYSVHTKVGRPPMMKASYYCGLRHFTDYVCIEHGNYAGRKAQWWWRARTDLPFPPNTSEALRLSTQLKPASHLQVWINKQHPEIIQYCFDGTNFGRLTVPEMPRVNSYQASHQDVNKGKPQFEDDDIPF